MKVLGEGTALTRRAQWITIGCILVAVAGLSFTGILAEEDKTLGYVGLTLLITGFGAAMVLSRKLRHAVVVHSEGITELSTTIRWDEPHDLFLEGVRLMVGPISTAAQMTAKVVAPDGRRIAIHSSRMFNRGLAPVIARCSTEHNVKVMTRRLAAGETLAFGPIELTSTEVRIGRKRCAIDEIRSVKIEDGRLRMTLAGSWFSSKIRLAKIPNYGCLLHFIDRS